MPDLPWDLLLRATSCNNSPKQLWGFPGRSFGILRLLLSRQPRYLYLLLCPSWIPDCPNSKTWGQSTVTISFYRILPAIQISFYTRITYKNNSPKIWLVLQSPTTFSTQSICSEEVFLIMLFWGEGWGGGSPPHSSQIFRWLASIGELAFKIATSENEKTHCEPFYKVWYPTWLFRRPIMYAITIRTIKVPRAAPTAMGIMMASSSSKHSSAVGKRVGNKREYNIGQVQCKRALLVCNSWMASSTKQDSWSRPLPATRHLHLLTHLQ